MTHDETLSYQGSGRILGTLVYARQDNQILMLHRHKEPNKGLWVAPGGKVEARESPFECAARELREETGLQARKLTLRALVSETSPRADWQWLLFIYLAEELRRELIPCPEGQLAWVSIDAIPLLLIPPSDALFFPHVVGEGPLYQAKYHYDADLNLIHIEEY